LSTVFDSQYELSRSMTRSKDQFRRAGKFLTWLLRHRPGALDLNMDDEGWVEVDQLIAKSSDSHQPFSEELLQQIVQTDNKSRFSYCNCGKYIRANQGHSIAVDLKFEKRRPPKVLFHGTGTQFLQSISIEGLKPMERHHVHLSPDRKTAKQVGGRKGKPAILEIDSERMSADGQDFYYSQNGIWLVSSVAPDYINNLRALMGG
jgi:putative RNA 2'-phosphotransferase